MLNRLFITIIVIFLGAEVRSQTVQYTYDAGGYRTQRKLKVTLSPPLILNDTIKDSILTPTDTLPQEPEITAVQEQQMRLAMEYGVSVYPNPVQSALNITIASLAADGKNAELRLYDVSGRSVKEQIQEAERSEMDVSSLNTGIYFLRVFVDGKILQYRILKTE
ncbi:MAG: T9SS type A sorting domain-containing protein [Bacteroidota bacterium]